MALNRRRAAAIALVLLGLLLASLGLALVYGPAALIALGLALGALGLVGIDIGTKRR